MTTWRDKPPSCVGLPNWPAGPVVGCGAELVRLPRDHPTGAWVCPNCGISYGINGHDVAYRAEQAADRLEAENTKLREALKPFADYARRMVRRFRQADMRRCDHLTEDEYNEEARKHGEVMPDGSITCGFALRVCLAADEALGEVASDA